jgi:hypothetical protein
MGQPVGVAVQLHDVMRREGEPRWTAVVDALLAVAVVSWVVALSVLHPDATVRVAVPLVMGAVVVGRVLVLVEHAQRRRELGDVDSTSVETTEADVPHAA